MLQLYSKRAVIHQKASLPTNMLNKFLSLVLFIQLTLSGFRVDATQITMDQNGYSNIVVAVSPDIPNVDAISIIHIILACNF